MGQKPKDFRVGPLSRVLPNALLLLALFSLAACSTPPIRRTVEPHARDLQGGREVKVSVIQREIDAQIWKANVAAATGGGLLVALLDTGVNQSRAKTAEATVGDLRTALVDYDFDARTQELTKGVLADVPWVGTAPTFSKQHSDASMLADLDKASTAQVSFFDYYYGLSPNFDKLIVSAAVDIAPKVAPAGATPQQRTRFENLVYTRRFAIVNPLSAPSKDKPENEQRWSKDNAKLARLAIDASVERLRKLIVKGLLLTDEEEARINALKPAARGGDRIVEKSDEGTLVMRAGGLWVYLVPPTS